MVGKIKKNISNILVILNLILTILVHLIPISSYSFPSETSDEILTNYGYMYEVIFRYIHNIFNKEIDILEILFYILMLISFLGLVFSLALSLIAMFKKKYYKNVIILMIIGTFYVICICFVGLIISPSPWIIYLAWLIIFILLFSNIYYLLKTNIENT